MTAITGWAGGRLNTGLGWTTFFNSADLASCPNASSVLSSITAITNGTSLDMYIDVSVRLVIASSTVAAGANIGLWLYPLLDDGSTYGDGQFTAGTQAAKTPSPFAWATIPLYAAATQTNLIGYACRLVIPPGTFLPCAQNNSGFTLTSGTQTIKYRSYNIRIDNAS